MNKLFQSLRDYTGITVISDPCMVEAGEPVITKRSLKERLFTRPWRPLMKTSVHVPMIPLKEYRLINGKIYMHPAIFKEVQVEIEKRFR